MPRAVPAPAVTPYLPDPIPTPKPIHNPRMPPTGSSFSPLILPPALSTIHLELQLLLWPPGLLASDLRAPGNAGSLSPASRVLIQEPEHDKRVCRVTTSVAGGGAWDAVRGARRVNVTAAFIAAVPERSPDDEADSDKHKR